MSNRNQATQTISTTEARQQFSKLLNQVYRGEQRVIVEKSGIPVAAIISAHDLERFEQYEQRREERFAILDEIGEAFKDVPLDELEREVERAVREAREDLRRERAESGSAQ